MSVHPGCMYYTVILTFSFFQIALTSALTIMGECTILACVTFSTVKGSKQ